MIDVQVLAGWVGGAIGASISIPQIVRTLRVGTTGVSASTWALMAGVTGSWACWGLVHGNVPLVVTNAVACAGSLVVLVVLAKSGVLPSLWTLLLPAALVLVNSLFAMGVVPAWIAGIANTTSPVVIRAPQIRAVLDSTALGVSAATWALSCGSQVCWIVSSIGNDAWLLTANVTNLTTNLTLVALVRRAHAAERHSSETASQNRAERCW